MLSSTFKPLLFHMMTNRKRLNTQGLESKRVGERYIYIHESIEINSNNVFDLELSYNVLVKIKSILIKNNKDIDYFHFEAKLKYWVCWEDGDKIEEFAITHKQQRTKKNAENKSRHTNLYRFTQRLLIATSCSSHYSSTMVMKNYIVDTPIEFLSHNLSTLKPHNLYKVFHQFFSLWKNVHSTPTQTLRLSLLYIQEKT